MNCCICNKNINIINSKKIQNGTICNDCYNHLPNSIKNNIADYMSYEINSYIDTDKLYHNAYIDKFNQTASYGEIILDEHNGLIAFCKNVKNDKLPDNCHDIYKVLEIEDFDLCMKNPHFYKGNIYADIEVSIIFHNPDVKIVKVIKHNEKCDTKYIGNKAEYTIPAILGMFTSMLDRAREVAYKKECINLDEFFNEKEKMQYELAKATFMLDDYYDEIELKNQRNKLLKIYHPDECLDDTDCLKYSQKINEAYKILRKKLKG